MIDFEIPPFIKNQTQLIEMVAKQAMRPYSRQLMNKNMNGRQRLYK